MWGSCSFFQGWPFGTGSTVHYFGRGQGSTTTVLHVPGFSLLVFAHGVKGWPWLAQGDAAEGGRQTWTQPPDSLVCAEPRKSSVTVWLLLYTEKLLLLVMLCCFSLHCYLIWLTVWLTSFLSVCLLKSLAIIEPSPDKLQGYVCSASCALDVNRFH